MLSDLNCTARKSIVPDKDTASEGVLKALPRAKSLCDHGTSSPTSTDHGKDKCPGEALIMSVCKVTDRGPYRCIDDSTEPKSVKVMLPKSTMKGYSNS